MLLSMTIQYKNPYLAELVESGLPIERRGARNGAEHRKSTASKVSTALSVY